MISVEDLRQLIGYDALTGEFWWKVSRGPVAANYRAGTASHKGYSKVSIGGRNYYMHRVAWAIHFGSWPVGDIDHVNCNTSDNRIANLREANRSQNIGNQRLRKNSASGAKGVSWHKQNQRWRAYIVVDGRQHSLGLYDDVKSAADAYDRAAVSAFGEFAVLNGSAV